MHTYDRKLRGGQVAAAALQGSVPPYPLTLAQHASRLYILDLLSSQMAPTLLSTTDVEMMQYTSLLLLQLFV